MCSTEQLTEIEEKIYCMNTFFKNHNIDAGYGEAHILKLKMRSIRSSATKSILSRTYQF